MKRDPTRHPSLMRRAFAKGLHGCRPFARILAFRHHVVRATPQPFLIPPVARGESMSSHLSEEKVRYFTNAVADVRVGGDSLSADEHRDLIERRKANRHNRWRAATLSGVKPLQRRA
jgi:hypothetical protein